MRRHLLLVALFIFWQEVYAQTSLIIKGRIIDKKTGEPLTGVTVFSGDGKNTVITDADGNYSLKIPADTSTVTFSYLGYKKITQKASKAAGGKLDISLQSDEVVLETVEVVTDRYSASERIKTAQLGLENVSVKEAKLLPALFGEVDIIKVLQLKPGIKSGGEGMAGFYVRGGGVDQNLITIQEAPVYNPNHLFGFFSLFNSDAVKDVDVYKAGFPARYSGRLSSVLDFHMREASKEKWGVSGGIGLISSRLAVETPIKKNVSSLLIAGRRTYVDIFTDFVNRQNSNNPNYTQIPSYYFHDLNLKFNTKIGEKDNLSITAYYGSDAFRFNRTSAKSRFDWTNAIASAQWQHRYSNSFSSNHTLYFSSYNYLIDNSFNNASLNLGSGIYDIGTKNEWNYTPNENHTFKAGFDIVRHNFNINNFNFTNGTPQITSGQQRTGVQAGVYLSDDYDISPSIKINAGARVSSFFVPDGANFGLEPRLNARFNITPNTAFKLSYTRMYQYLHLISTSSASLPTDVWYPTTKRVKPQYSDMVAGGIHKNVKDNLLFVSIEGYYKWLSRAIDFKDGTQLIANPDLENDFIFGKGWAYGSELYLEKRKGKTTGWVGYTLSWTWRQFAEINNGEAFHPRFDRRHDISVVVMHELSKRVSVSATWVFNSGNFVTLAEGRYIIQDVRLGPRVVPIVDKRSNYQMPDYHRMDVSLIYKRKPKRGEADWSFSIYNVYSRANPYFIYYEEQKDAEGNTTGLKSKIASLFPILPSVTYNFKF